MKIRAHETFCVRKGWIRKGVKNIILNNRLFTDKEVNPCDVLGIGANMVKSLRYWLNVVGIMEEVPDGNQKIQRLTELGSVSKSYPNFFLFDDAVIASGYVKKIKEVIDKSAKFEPKAKKVLNKYLNYLLAFYKL